MNEIGTRRGAGKRLPKRQEFLQWLIESPGDVSDGTLLGDARKRFHEILRTSTSLSPVEWLFNQLIGTPRTTIVTTIADKEVVAAASRATARYLKPEEFEAWWVDLRAELGESPFDSTEPTN